MGVQYAGDDIGRASYFASHADALHLEFSFDRVNADDGTGVYVVDVPLLPDAADVRIVEAPAADEVPAAEYVVRGADEVDASIARRMNGPYL